MQRLEPETWGPNKTKVDGLLKKYSGKVSLEQIKEDWGGGVYIISLRAPDHAGRLVFKARKRIDIAGPPKIEGHDIEDARKRENGVGDDIVKQALNGMMNNRTDPALQSLISSQQEEMRELRAAMREKDAQMLAIISKGKETTASDMLLGKMVEGESTRLTQMRDQHASEIRMKEDFHRDEIKRLNDRFDDIRRETQNAHTREIETLRRAGDREIDNMRRAHEREVDTLKVSYEGQIKSLERENNVLERDIGLLKTEVTELRARKDKGAVETLTELTAIKTAFDEFSGGNESPEGGTIERLINSVLGSSVAESVAQRIAEAPAGTYPGEQSTQTQPTQSEQPRQSEQPELPIGKPVRAADGAILVRRPDNSVAVKQPDGTKFLVKPDGSIAPLPATDIDPEHIKIAAQTMEKSFEMETPPEQFASKVAVFIPEDTLEAIKGMIRDVGIDSFLADVAKLPQDSPLLTQAGKNWTRQVSEHLLSPEK